MPQATSLGKEGSAQRKGLRRSAILETETRETRWERAGGSALGSSRGRGRPPQGGATRDGVRAAGLSRAGSCVFRTIVECFFINSALPSPQRLSGHPGTSTPGYKGPHWALTRQR